MKELEINPNIETPDDVYEAILKAHEGMNEKESYEYNARLILVLANQIGEKKLIFKAIEAAKK